MAVNSVIVEIGGNATPLITSLKKVISVVKELSQEMKALSSSMSSNLSAGGNAMVNNMRSQTSLMEKELQKRKQIVAQYRTALEVGNYKTAGQLWASSPLVRSTSQSPWSLSSLGGIATQQLLGWRDINSRFKLGPNGQAYGYNIPSDYVPKKNPSNTFSQAFDESSGGFGKYILAGVLGGRTGMAGAALFDMGRKFQKAYNQITEGSATGNILGGGAQIVGAGMMAGGFIFQSIKAIESVGKTFLTLQQNLGGLLGISKEGFLAYADFDKALRQAANNLHAGPGNPDVTQSFKAFKEASMQMAATYGLGGSAVDYANSMRAISGMGGIENAGQVIKIAGLAAQLSSVSESTTPEQSARAIVTIGNAIRGVGIKTLSDKDLTAAMYVAGARSPLQISDLQKNASGIATTIAAGASPAEAFATYMFLSQFGYNAAKAGTQMASIRARMPAALHKKGFDTILGLSQEELINLTPSEFIHELSSKAAQEKLNTKYGLQGGSNPLLERRVLNDVTLTLQEIFGLRGGQMMSLLSTEDGTEILQSFIEQLSNASDSTKIFNDAVINMSKSPSMAIANVQGAISNWQNTIVESMAPALSSAFGISTNSAEQARLNQIIQNGGTLTNEQQSYLERLKLQVKPNLTDAEKEKLLHGGPTPMMPLETMDEIQKRLLGKNTKGEYVGGGEYQPGSITYMTAELSIAMGNLIQQFTGQPKLLEDSIKNLVGIFSMLTGVLMGFADVIIWLIGMVGSPESKARAKLYGEYKDMGFNQKEAMTGAFSVPIEKVVQTQKNYDWAHAGNALTPEEQKQQNWFDPGKTWEMNVKHMKEALADSLKDPSATAATEKMSSSADKASVAANNLANAANKMSNAADNLASTIPGIIKNPNNSGAGPTTSLTDPKPPTPPRNTNNASSL